MSNALYDGDNLYYLRNLPSESVDLVYLDPPFNSKSTYNLLFRTPQGDAVQAQTAAFKDTWWWDTPAAQAFDDVIASGSPSAAILVALRKFLGESDMMAYLAMMAVRFIEMRRILRHTGSLYVHCDATASHYLKILLDGIFGSTNFRNEIVWKRKAGRGETNRKAIRFGTSHDCILFYSRSDKAVFHRQYRPSNPSYIQSKFTHDDGDGRIYRLDNLTSPSPRPNLRYEYKGYSPPANGWAVSRKRMEEMEREGRLYFPERKDRRIQRKRYLDELPGETVDTLWDDIPPVNSQARERLGYPTQKPVALLERILSTSTDPGQTVLDPFCGCGTTIEAAQNLGRRWLGVDITHHAIEIIEARLNERCPDARYSVKGRPEDLDSARRLAKDEPYEFQWWANWLLGVQNYLEYKKGADKGIDGIIYFRNGPWGIGQIIVSVKGGQNIGPKMISELTGTVNQEDAQLGVFVCLTEPTKHMRETAARAGFVQTAQGRFQQIQIATISDLLSGRRPSIPVPIETDAFRRPLRPARPQKVEAQEQQLSLALPIAGGKSQRQDAKEHLSGHILARVGG